MTLQSIAIKAHVDADGVLRLAVPVNIASADVDVIVVIGSIQDNPITQHTVASKPDPSRATLSTRAEELGWPLGFIEATYGILRDDPVERLPQGGFDEREALE